MISLTLAIWSFEVGNIHIHDGCIGVSPSLDVSCA